MPARLPIKKSVSVQWQGKRLELDVAQELFSSHQVDRGSRLLLASLAPLSFAPGGNAADFGCGYGVLGIAWQARFPDWTMHYVDRDALAVVFAQHNVRKTLPDQDSHATFTCDVSLPVGGDGYDLVLWNVPGKVGREVIAGLTRQVIAALAVGGLLAAVIVNPLVDLLTDVDVAAASVVHVERGKSHTVVHIRRTSGEVTAHRPFEAGLFDRPAASFGVDDLHWTLTPVTGLPEYDSLNHATVLAVNQMIALAERHHVRRWMVYDPGTGHLAVVARMLWPHASGVVRGRDMLALLATARALGNTGDIDIEVAWGIEDVTMPQPVDLIIVALPEQAQAEELAHLLASLAPLLRTGGNAIYHGRSTELARLDTVIRREEAWRARKPVKYRGAGVIVAERRNPT